MQISFHAVGEWDESHVVLERAESSRAVDAEIETAIDLIWSNAQAQRAAERKQMRLFDGPMCRLESFDASDNRLTLRLSRTSYKVFLATHLSGEQSAQFNSTQLANALGVSAALVTADDRLLLGRRNDAVAYYPNRVHPFAGTLEPRDDQNAFDAIRRELHEELSLEPAALSDLRCLGIIEDRRIRHPELIFAVRCVQLSASLSRAVRVEEHGSSWDVAVDPNALLHALSSEVAFTPVARGTIALLGRHRFGDDWLDRAAKVIAANLG